MIKSPFTEKDERASDVLGLVYTDVYGPRAHVPEEGIAILLHSQMTYSVMGMST